MDNVWHFLSKDPEWIMILLSSLTSATLCGFLFEKDNERKKASTLICRAVLFPVLAVVLGIIAIALFALYQYYSVGSDFLQTTTNIIRYFCREKLLELICIPILVEICMMFLSSRGSKKVICLISFVVSFVMLTIMPNFITFRTYYPLAIEESILQEIRRSPIIWNISINDIEIFKTQAEQGYMIYGKLEEEGTTETPDSEEVTQSTTGSNESGTPDATEGKQVAIDNLSFSELLVYVNNETNLNDERAKAALKRADVLFATGNYDKNNYHDIGLYWYFKGFCEENITYYQQAIPWFEQDKNNYMLGQSYRLWGTAIKDSELLSKAITYYELYLTQYNSSAASWQIANIQYFLHNDFQRDTLENALEYYIKSVEFSSDKNGFSNTLEILTDIFSELYVQKEYSDYKTFLETLCFLRPNDLFFNYINIVGMLADGVALEEVPITLDYLLTIETYKNCPKLLLTKAYLLYKDQESAASEYMGIRDYIFEVYGSNPEFFAAEDIINLAWLYQREGLYIKAYQLATDVMKMVTTEDIQSQALLLIAEAYLYPETKLTNVNEIRLYDNIKEETKNLIHNGKDGTAIILRLQVCEGILGYRLGVENALTGLSDRCAKLFGSDSINTTYLVAFLEYADGRYGECVKMCNQILEKYDANDYSYHEVLFLKAEALMAQASELSVDERFALYEEAEMVLLTVKNAVEDDYILSLERLHALYKAMPNREAELQEVTEKLFGVK